MLTLKSGDCTFMEVWKNLAIVKVLLKSFWTTFEQQVQTIWIHVTPKAGSFFFQML